MINVLVDVKIKSTFRNESNLKLTSQLKKGNVVVSEVQGYNLICMHDIGSYSSLQLVPRMYGSFPKESHYQLAKITNYSVEVMDPDLQLPSLGGGIQSFSIRLKVR